MGALDGQVVGVIGLGYVGLPLAEAVSGAGARVVGYDTSAPLVERLAAGNSHVGDVPGQAVKEMLERRALFTTDAAALGDCAVFVICVPTPLKEKYPDLGAVRAASQVVGAAMSAGDLVILESTTYPGTTKDVVAPILAEASGLVPGKDFHLAFSPERIDPGNSRYGIRNTTKVVGGLTPSDTAAAERFYSAFVDDVFLVKSPAEAEMAKLLENTFRHVNIALVNEMAIFCRELGVDLNSAIDAAATKPFGFMAFRPGPGVGGHCIPIDPSYLSWRVRQLGYSFRFVELAEEINDRMPAYVVSRSAALLNDVSKPLRGSEILMIGVAYKKDISDVRESPVYSVARRLMTAGASVSWYDPFVESFMVDDATTNRVDELDPVSLRRADLTVVITDHTGIDWDHIREHAQLILDTRNVYGSHTAGVAGL